MQAGKTVTIRVFELSKGGTWVLYASNGTQLTPPSKLNSKGSGSIKFTIEPGSAFLQAVNKKLQVYAKDSKGLITGNLPLNPGT